MQEDRVVKPTVSIIIVTYNAAKTLQKCLDSIYQQEYPSTELVIIDGASKDGTVKILEENSHRINFWLSEPDSGIYDAMNKALNYVTGDWLYFLGADDELLEGFSLLAHELEDTSAVYYGSVFSRGKKCSGYIKRYYQAKVGMYHQSMMYPSKVFKKHKYNLRYPISADYVLNMEVAGDPEFKFIFKDYIVANFNHTGVSGESGDEFLAADKSKLIRKNFGLGLWCRYRFRELKRELKIFVGLIKP